MCGYFGDCNERIELPPPAIIKPVELWTGKQLIGVMLRPNSESNVQVNTVLKERNYSGKGEHMCINDGFVIFQNSELLCGNLCKTTMGEGSKSGLYYSLIRDNSVKVAAACMSRIAKFAARWLSTYGLSIGINDVTPFKQLNDAKRDLLDNGYKQCDDMIQVFKDGKLELKAGCNADQTLESNMQGELSKIRETAGEILKNNLPRHNAPLIMAISGSKGSNINLC
jgi:DNA-directed RNA polymerase III subunit RPC1